MKKIVIALIAFAISVSAAFAQSGTVQPGIDWGKENGSYPSSYNIPPHGRMGSPNHIWVGHSWGEKTGDVDVYAVNTQMDEVFDRVYNETGDFYAAYEASFVETLGADFNWNYVSYYEQSFGTDWSDSYEQMPDDNGFGLVGVMNNASGSSTNTYKFTGDLDDPWLVNLNDPSTGVLTLDLDGFDNFTNLNYVTVTLFDDNGGTVSFLPKKTSDQEFTVDQLTNLIAESQPFTGAGTYTFFADPTSAYYFADPNATELNITRIGIEIGPYPLGSAEGSSPIRYSFPNYSTYARVSNIRIPGGSDPEPVEVPEPATYAYGVMGLISVIGMKKRFGK